MSLCHCLCPSVSVSVSLSLSLSLSFVFVSRGWQGQGKVRDGDSQALCLTSSGRVLVFLCDQVGFPAAHLSFVCSSHGGGRLRPSQVWQGPEQFRRLRVGLPTLVKPQRISRGVLFDVLVSEQGQKSSSSGLTLPQQNQQAGTQTQSASSLDLPQNGLVQLPAYWEQPGARMPRVSTSQLGTMRTPLAGDDLNSNASSLTLN